MNTQSQWRIAIAEKIAPLYARVSGVRAVVLIGGVARGRGDAYSDIDIAVFHDHAPDELARRNALEQFARVLNMPVVIGDLQAIEVFDNTHTGMLWEEAAYIGGNERHGLKIDVNHRTVMAMNYMIDDVLMDYDAHGHKLEVCYSIQRVHILHGADLIEYWQTRVRMYPDALAHKLVVHHLAQLRADGMVHIARGDLHLFYAMVAQALTHIMGALLALNRIYPPELKRLADLCDEMAIKPTHLAERFNALFERQPADLLYALSALVDEVFTIVEDNMPQINTEPLRERFFNRHRPQWEQAPNQQYEEEKTS